jgi:hypothetical protein
MPSSRFMLIKCTTSWHKPRYSLRFHPVPFSSHFTSFTYITSPFRLLFSHSLPPCAGTSPRCFCLFIRYRPRPPICRRSAALRYHPRPPTCARKRRARVGDAGLPEIDDCAAHKKWYPTPGNASSDGEAWAARSVHCLCLTRCTAHPESVCVLGCR